MKNYKKIIEFEKGHTMEEIKVKSAMADLYFNSPFLTRTQKDKKLRELERKK